MPTPFLTLTCFWLALACLTAVLLYTQTTRFPASKIRLASLIAIVAIGGFVTSSLSGPSLFGLEYEDAFEYAYSGALLSLLPGANSEGLNPICLSGTITKCDAIGSLSHPIGLSVLVSWLTTSMGWSAHYVQWLSAAASLGIAIGLFFSAKLFGMGPVGATSSALLFLTTPIFATLASSGFAEPLAAALLLYAVSLTTWTLRAKSVTTNESATKLLLPCVTLSIVIALAANVRRENLLLAFALPVMSALVAWTVTLREDTRRAKLSWLAAACLSGLLLAEASNHSGLHSRQAVAITSNDALFSIRYFSELAPAFLWSATDWRRWFFLPAAVLLGLLEVRRRRILVIPLGIVVLYMGTFLSFSQSWYFIKLGEVPWLHFERYALQIAPCLALIGGAGVEATWGFLRSHVPRRSIIAASVVVVFAWVTTGLVLVTSLKRQYAAEEAAIRVEPIVRACEEVPTDATIVTTESILVSLFCGPTRKVVTYGALGREVGAAVLRSAEQNGGLYLLESQLTSIHDATRYPLAVEMLSTKHWELVSAIDTGNARYLLYRILLTSSL